MEKKRSSKSKSFFDDWYIPMRDSHGRLSPIADVTYQVLSVCLHLGTFVIALASYEGQWRFDVDILWWLIPISALYILLLIYRHACLTGRAAWAIAALVLTPYLVGLAYLLSYRGHKERQSSNNIQEIHRKDNGDGSN